MFALGIAESKARIDVADFSPVGPTIRRCERTRFFHRGLPLNRECGITARAQSPRVSAHPVSGAAANLPLQRHQDVMRSFDIEAVELRQLESW
jgi:hypothetical protein